MTPIGPTKYMTVEDIAELRKAAKLRCRTGSRARVTGRFLVEMALGTGLRVSELQRLTLGDLNVKRKYICVVRSKKRKGKDDVIAMGDELKAAIVRFLKWRESLGDCMDDSEPLFLGRNGALKTVTLKKMWRDVADAAGLDGEGLQICEGTIDWIEFLAVVKDYHGTMIPEIWRGHQRGGEGFIIAINRLSEAYFKALER